MIQTSQMTFIQPKNKQIKITSTLTRHLMYCRDGACPVRAYPCPILATPSHSNTFFDSCHNILLLTVTPQSFHPSKTTHRQPTPPHCAVDHTPYPNAEPTDSLRPYQDNWNQVPGVLYHPSSHRRAYS